MALHSTLLVSIHSIPRIMFLNYVLGMYISILHLSFWIQCWIQNDFIFTDGKFIETWFSLANLYRFQKYYYLVANYEFSLCFCQISPQHCRQVDLAVKEKSIIFTFPNMKSKIIPKLKSDHTAKKSSLWSESDQLLCLDVWRLKIGFTHLWRC